MGLSISDLNPATWPGQVKKRLAKDFGFLGEESESTKQQRADLKNQADEADAFREAAQASWGRLGDEAAASREAMRRRAMGQDSLSAEQLRQGLQQQLAAQRSMAASAAPQNAAMAARLAAINMGRAQYGMSGQAAMAGIAERAAAERALQDAILGQRAQDVQASLGAGANAINATTGQKAEGSFLDKYGPAGAAAAGAIVKSDRNLKRDIRPADDKALSALSKLGSYSFRYKDEKHGRGPQLGVLAQELRKVGLRNTVRSASDGLEVDTGKLTAANTAAIAALARKLKPHLMSAKKNGPKK